MTLKYIDSAQMKRRKNDEICKVDLLKATIHY